MVLSDTIDQLDLIYIYNILHPQTVKYTFFSSTHGAFSSIDHTLSHKTSLNKLKRIEIISSIFSNHNGIKLESNYRRENGKRTNTWRINNMLLKN